mmetsp:Transcript_18721/g.58653  ORF Transcript_18721/g.58653 Transcript_18721/m.58653 type:complete len:273 (+) Transcript_18721:83-901(+)
MQMACSPRPTRRRLRSNVIQSKTPTSSDPGRSAHASLPASRSLSFSALISTCLSMPHPCVWAPCTTKAESESPRRLRERRGPAPSPARRRTPGPSARAPLEEHAVRDDELELARVVPDQQRLGPLHLEREAEGAHLVLELLRREPPPPRRVLLHPAEGAHDVDVAARRDEPAPQGVEEARRVGQPAEQVGGEDGVEGAEVARQVARVGAPEGEARLARGDAGGGRRARAAGLAGPDVPKLSRGVERGGGVDEALRVVDADDVCKRAALREGE